LGVAQGTPFLPVQQRIEGLLRLLAQNKFHAALAGLAPALRQIFELILLPLARAIHRQAENELRRIEHRLATGNIPDIDWQGLRRPAHRAQPGTGFR
jgi:hypothetical protein